MASYYEELQRARDARAEALGYTAPGGGRVVQYEDDPSIGGYTPTQKTDRNGVTRTSFASPEGITLASLYGSGPTPAGYTATLRPVNAAAPAPVVKYGMDSGYVKTNTARLGTSGNPAIAAIDTAAPTKRNLFAESGYQAKPRFASSVMDAGGGIAGMYAPNMDGVDPWGPKLRGPAGKGAVQQAGFVYGRPAAARAPAPAPKPTVAQTIASMFLSNGVANPAYRDYTPSYSSEGGGVMPSSSYSGSFTDSLGGTYYDRHL